jgi:hypothetical protein
VCCSYCGKEIGAFRLLRDSEFCCALHREKYGERLGRALHEIAAPAPAPAGLAGFLIRMPLQPGKLTSTLTPRQTAGSRNPIRTGSSWPLTIDCSDAPSEPAPGAESARGECPPPSQRWRPSPPAEPVAALLPASAALAPANTPRAPRFAAGLKFTPVLDRVLDTPPVCPRWMPSPPAEPVAALLSASAALAPAGTPRAPRFAAGLKLAPLQDSSPTACNLWMPTPPADVAQALVPAVSRLVPTRIAGVARCRTTNVPMSGDAAGMSACATSYSAPSVEPASVPPRMPAPQFTAVLEPLAAPDLPFETPAVCQHWMSAPAPDPVFRYLRASTEPAATVPVALKLPDFALSAAAPHVPRIAQPRSMAHAEPVIAAVRPGTAHAPVIPFLAAEIALPAIPQTAWERAAAEKPASPPAPEAVESLLVAAHAAVPLSMERAPADGVELATPPAVLEPVPAIGKLLAGDAPAALESPLMASMAAPIAPAVALRMPPFALAANQERTVARFDTQRLAPPARKPDAAAPGRVPPQPLATLAAAPPAQARLLLRTGLPHPGPLPIEFHTHRLAGAPAASPQSILPRPALRPPGFGLRPVLEKLAEPAAQPNAARQAPDRIAILKMPAARRPPTVLMVAGRVAAGFVLAAALWSGAASFRGRRLAAREDIFSSDDALSAANNARSVSLPNGGAPAQPARQGPVAWVRQAIANRAAIKIAENFRGMENWDRGTKGDAAGWSRHPDGYMNTGALALFRPTLKFTDYRMEFFGQIERKSIGWTVHAADARNYHAMKLTVVEAGIRPFVALVHYNVVNGKSGRQTRTPLNVMVHNNRPMQLAVDVQGNRLTTWIDGEEVDSFLDNTLLAGGVGFFSEAGERARLYWVRVSTNDDWLGHVCAMFAEAAGVGSLADVRRPEFPGGAPAPGLPGDRDGRTLAAVWAAMPYLRGRRKTRFFETWRSQPWNT